MGDSGLVHGCDFSDGGDFEEVADWPNCTTPDCENKQCTWAGLPLCFPCAERRVGREEMIRRFNATHEITWEQAR